MQLFHQLFRPGKNEFQLAVVAVVLSLSSLQLEAQEMMIRGKRHKVELEGESLRPAKAFQITHSVCPIAGQHFAKARKMRRWNAVLLNVGITEVVVSILAIERDQLVLGIATGIAGGAMETIISGRMNRIDQELNLGVKAYNNCMLWR
jgi:hypothetical protein|tara:strand:- start:88 stop:531 length:444 start_codon:yes stop_codon:yes gene_type:complete